MLGVALKMLFGDKAKYFGLIFGITFATFLMAQQISIFLGVMSRTRAQIDDVIEPDVWVMDPRVQYVDEIEALSDYQLGNVRSVDGVKWAVPFYKGNAVVRSLDGQTQQIILMGIDDSTLVGGPHNSWWGDLSKILLPQAMIMDRAGYEYMWPGEDIKLPREVEINDQRMIIYALTNASPPFLTFPVCFVKYSDAIRVVPPQRKLMSFVLAKAGDGVDPVRLARKIESDTGLQALTSDEFGHRSYNHYLTRTGIPVNFGTTITLGFIVGAAIAAQTFYLFVVENLRQFGALKAIGVTNGQILSMVVLQAAVVGAVGFGLGIGCAATFFFLTKDITALRGFILLPEVIMLVGSAVFVIMMLAAFFSIRKVVVVDPAVVFRG